MSAVVYGSGKKNHAGAITGITATKAVSFARVLFTTHSAS
jgi:hypothetical protein